MHRPPRAPAEADTTRHGGARLDDLDRDPATACGGRTRAVPGLVPVVTDAGPRG